MRDPRIKFFDDVADSWDKNIPNYTDSAPFKGWWSQVNLKPGHCVLEIGCGTGRLLPLIWQRIQPDGKLYAMDFSSKMLAIARERCADIPADFLCVPAHSIPLDDNFFDVVFLACTYPHLRPRKRSLIEISRILKPSSGRLYLAHFSSRNEINKIHRSIGGPVKNDTIFTANKMKPTFNDCNLRVMSIEDTPNYFFLTAKTSVRKSNLAN
jgi:ubiquinone/menaquinone biosynthesis C-methylase UbiE